MRAEAADVLYHLLVLLKARGVPLASVIAELESRTRQSGHQEKARARVRREAGGLAQDSQARVVARD